MISASTAKDPDKQVESEVLTQANDNASSICDDPYANVNVTNSCGYPFFTPPDNYSSISMYGSTTSNCYLRYDTTNFWSGSQGCLYYGGSLFRMSTKDYAAGQFWTLLQDGTTLKYVQYCLYNFEIVFRVF